MSAVIGVHDPEVQVALYRSAVYEALSLGFAYPTVEQRERLSILLEDMLESEAVVHDELREYVRGLLGALEAADSIELSAEHNRLFDQSPLCSPFETEYEADPFAKTRQLADIAGFYHAFGMDVSRDRPTMPDFAGSELEFMSLLSRKEAYAAIRGWTRNREIAVDAQRAFLRDHLGRWERTLGADIATALEADDHAPAHFFILLAGFCERFVEDDMHRVRVKPLRLKRRMMGSPEPMACPLAPAVTALDAGSLALGDAEQFAAEELN